MYFDVNSIKGVFLALFNVSLYCYSYLMKSTFKAFLFGVGICFCSIVGAAASDDNVVHPFDALLLDLSSSLKSGTVSGRVDVSDTVLSCAGFFKAMQSEISQTKHGTSDVISGLNKMSGDMSDLSYLLMTGIVPNVRKEIDESLVDHSNRELVILKTNGLESVAFVHRYKECEQVYFFSNYVLINGQGAVSEAIEKLSE